jgi:hypothetical protein
MRALTLQPRRGVAVKPDQQSSSNIVEFRPRNPGPRGTCHEARPDDDIWSSLDLSRYEVKRPDHSRVRMAANVAALVLIVTLAAAAAVDVVDIKLIESCAPAWQCGFAH